MNHLRRPTFFILFCSAAFSFFPGCNDNDLRYRVEIVESRLSAPAEKNEPSRAAAGQSSQSLLPPNAAPIREIADTSSTGRRQNETVWTFLRASLLAPSPFRARHEKNGQLTLSAAGSFGQLGEKWLQSQGFSKRKNDLWEKRMSAADLPDLEQKTAEALNQVTNNMDKAMSWLNSIQPGHVYFKNDQPLPGTVVPTGHMLDFAFVEQDNAREFFIDMGEAQTLSQVPFNNDPSNNKIAVPPYKKTPHYFMRGGQLVVKNDGVYFNNNSIFRLNLSPVPRIATHLALSTEGIVTAFDAAGRATELGRIPVARVKSFKDGVVEELAPEFLDDYVRKNGRGPFRPGYLEFASDPAQIDIPQSATWRNTLIALQSGINAAPQPATPGAAEPDPDILPLIVHTPLPKTAEHLTALKIPVEKTNDRTTIGYNADETDVANALVTVLQGLRKRMAVHEENLRNAGKTRDSEGRLNAYRRKTVAIGPQGNIVEGVDKSDLPKSYKPGDPDAGPDGFIMLSNVNKAIEVAEFKETIEEYKLVRTALERLAPKHVFPDPPQAP